MDIRIRRSVQAAGFKDKAFELLLGDRHVWMRSLGNQCVADGASGIRIKDPRAAEDLLNLALENPRRRVIFFCGCEWPRGCHRHKVAELVARAANKRKIALEVDEWPGGESKQITLNVTAAVLKKVRAGAKRMPIPNELSIGAAASLPWGTIATLRVGDEAVTLLVGPARFDSSGGHLGVLKGPMPRTGVVAAAERLRKRFKIVAMRV